MLAPGIPMSLTQWERQGMEEDPSGAAHLVKPVHIVGQQVDYLACGGLSQGRAT